MKFNRHEKVLVFVILLILNIIGIIAAIYISPGGWGVFITVLLIDVMMICILKEIKLTVAYK